ncbi:MAG: sugar phosphate isomerase/epimerase [Phycisphaerales bacterium]|nr:MAG: sugar phosphate isomerase/epimerase [Phycisphaerales bacterium]
MKLGFVTAILPDLPFEEVVLFAAETGYSCVEVMCWPKGKAERRYAGVTHIDVTSFKPSDADQINALLKDTGIGISSLGYYPNYLTPDAAEAKMVTAHFKKVIKASAMLGIGCVTTFVGRDWTKSVDDNWPQFKKVWKPLVKFAEAQQVRIGIENCPMLFTNDEWPGGKNLAHSPHVWRRMFEEIPSDYFGLNYDPSHLIWQHIDYIKPLWEFKDRIFHAHAKDVRLDQERLDEVGILATPLQYHSPKLPGLGEVNWGRYCSVLGEIGYTGPVCVEVEDRAYEASLETRKAALQQSARYLSQYMP